MQSGERAGEEWIEEAQACLGERYDRLRRGRGSNLSPTFVIKPHLDASEAEHFVRGMQNGIFSVDDEGYVQSDVLPLPSRKGTRNKILCLFWWRAGRPYLFREGICQVSTVAAL